MRTHPTRVPAPRPAARARTALPCACTTLRKAARAVARVYEGALAEAGLTATQFAVLRALQRHAGAAPLSRLAEEMVLERTSLYRALAPLARERLVRFTGAGDKRAKAVTLTPQGRARIAAALPHWTTAHESFVRAFGAARWRETARVLEASVTVARGLGLP